jgi:hypothetical protein
VGAAGYVGQSRQVNQQLGRANDSPDDRAHDARVSFRVNDQNSCDQNPTGAVTRNVSVNSVDLVQNTTTPGQGEEPGFTFSITATGRVTQ